MMSLPAQILVTLKGNPKTIDAHIAPFGCIVNAQIPQPDTKMSIEPVAPSLVRVRASPAVLLSSCPETK